MEPKTAAGFNHSMSMGTSVGKTRDGGGSLVAAAAGRTAVRAAARTRPGTGRRAAALVVAAPRARDEHEGEDQERDEDDDRAAAAGARARRRGRPGITALEKVLARGLAEGGRHDVARDGGTGRPGDLVRRLFHRQQRFA